ncbi:hypothetical protein VPH35_021543 [Triticum aestivum]
MMIETENKGKEVVPTMEKDKEVVLEDPRSGKHQNYGHYHEEGGPTHFCKVILDPKLECLLMTLDFMKHFPVVLMDFKLKTNIGCAWRVTVRLMSDRVILDKGWAPFTVVHWIKIGYMVAFKLLTPDMLKVIVFNDDGIEVATKYGRHDGAFILNI